MVGVVIETHLCIGPRGQLAGEGHAVDGFLVGDLVPSAGTNVIGFNFAIVAAAMAADGRYIKGVLGDVGQFFSFQSY